MTLVDLEKHIQKAREWGCDANTFVEVEKGLCKFVYRNEEKRF